MSKEVKSCVGTWFCFL